MNLIEALEREGRRRYLENPQRFAESIDKILLMIAMAEAEQGNAEELYQILENMIKPCKACFH